MANTITASERELLVRFYIDPDFIPRKLTGDTKEVWGSLSQKLNGRIADIFAESLGDLHAPEVIEYVVSRGSHQ